MIKLHSLFGRSSITESKLTYSQEHVDSYDGQDNYEIGVYKDNEILGVVEYTLFNNEISINMITVRPEYRRMGVGARLVQKMKELHPNAKYTPSLKTDLGVKFKHKNFSDSEMSTIND